MVKKLQTSPEDTLAAAAAGLMDSQLAQTVKDSAQQIWLAGLGAFAKAQGSRGKVFETLMKEGVNLQRKTQAAAGEKINEKFGDMADKMSAMAGEVGHKANAQWDRLETIFEERTARALGRLGVPSAKELAALTARVDALAAALARLGGGADGGRRQPSFKPGKDVRGSAKAAATPAAKPARKAAVRRKVAAGTASTTSSAKSSTAAVKATKATKALKAARAASPSPSAAPAAATPQARARRKPSA